MPDGHEYARRIEMPFLASKSKGLLCSMLALGAACLCIDLLLGSDPIAAADRVAHLVKSGDHYHRKALTAVLSKLGTTKCSQELDIVHAQAAILWAYTLARRRVFRLLQRQQPELALVEQESDADAPQNLEWACLLRGVTAVTKARSTRSFQDNNDKEWMSIPESDLPDAFVSTYVAQAVEVERDLFSLLSPCAKSGCGHKHVMNNVISSSVAQALDKLHGQVNILELKLRHKQHSDTYCGSLAGIESHFSVMCSLVACYSAVVMLETTANGIFGMSQSTKTRSLEGSPSSGGKAFGSHPLNQWPSFKGSPWLKALCARSPSYDPFEPVTRGLLPWIGHLPKEYFDILVTHHPDRLKATSLTVEQQIHYLAWDIYAHWLVLTILMEHEAWWWADMAHSDIPKLRDTLPKSDANGYGVEVGMDNWWPGQMWSLAEKLGI
ncbi:MAG: hypothetical protein Q9160_008182 [Pyrenula sp. 1 TL-2023]